MAKLFGNEPKWSSTQVVLGEIVKQFDDSWMVFAEVDFRKVTPGIVVPSDADIFLCHPQHGFCFIECKGGGIRRSENKKWQQYQYKDPRKIGWQNIDPNKQAEQARRVFLEWGKSNDLLKKSFTQTIALVAFPNASKTGKVYSPDVEKVAIWGEDLAHISKKILELLPLSGDKFFNQSDLRNALVGEIPPLEWILPAEKIHEELQLENSQLNLKLKELEQREIWLSEQRQSPELTKDELKKLNDQQNNLRSDIQSLTQAIASISTQDDLRSDIQSLTQAVSSIPKQDDMRSEIQSIKQAISSIPSQQGLDDQKQGKLIAAITFVGLAIIVSAFILVPNRKSEDTPSAQINKNYESCRDLYIDFPTGVAKNAESVGSTGAEDNLPVYDLNYKKLDGDNDGVACELWKYPTCEVLRKYFPTGVAKNAESVGSTEAVVNPTAYDLNYKKLDPESDGVAC
ncbi:MAG: excalibur calcium-binding domain-containing protein [Ilumatobacteraceae bacterium]